MAKQARRGSLFCSFCRKPDEEVERLVGGPGIYICDACVAACNRILKGYESKGAQKFAGWESYTDAQLLQSLAPSEATLEAVRGDLQTKIDILRRRGMSWSVIGEALGITRQAAWERFS